MFRAERMKRAAHREAWYSESFNPFRRTHTNQSTPLEQQPNGVVDVEAGEGGLNTQRRPTDQQIPGNQDAISPVSEKSNERGVGGGVDKSSEASEKTQVDNSQRIEEKHHGKIGGLLSGMRHRKDKKESEEVTRSTTGTSSKSTKKPPKFTFANQIKGTIFNSWINILIIAAPVGIALNYTSVRQSTPIVIFLVNFIAIIPLAALLSFATEEIALRVGEVLGGLLNASFGNAVELIVTIIALVKKEVVIVKTSLIGSILSNLLLVMGMCFFFGGLRRQEQFFNQTVATTAASLLALAIASIIIPTVFDDVVTTAPDSSVSAISRGTAIILLVVYACYLFFQLKTHSAVFQETSQKVAMKPRKNHVAKGTVFKGLAVSGALGAAPARAHTFDDSGEHQDIVNPQAYEQAQAEEDDEPEVPTLHIFVALGLLAGSTVIIALCAEFMVDSINDFTAEYNISQEFVGLILLPIVGNAAEHATAVTVACKDKMDLAIGVAVGSSMQIALLVIPFAVILGWILGIEDMNLSFDGFQVAVLFVSILLVNYLIGDGKSHWLEGVLLQCLYVIIATTYVSSTLAICCSY